MQQRGTGLFANLQVAHVRAHGSVPMPNTSWIGSSWKSAAAIEPPSMTNSSSETLTD